MKASEIAVFFGDLVFRINGCLEDGGAGGDLEKCAKLLDGGKYILLAPNGEGRYRSYLFNPLETQVEIGAEGIISTDSDCVPVVDATVIEACGSSIGQLLSVLPGLKNTLLGRDA